MSKTLTLHPKLESHRLTALAINRRSLSVNEYGKLEGKEEDYLERRIVRGYAVMWKKKNKHNERWHKGAFAKSIRERGPGSNSNYRIKFLYGHNPNDPLALIDVLKEDETGLYFETAPLDDVPNADRLLKQLRSGTINNFSQGFDFVWDKMEWNEREQLIEMFEGMLFEISAVGIPSDMDTFAKRSAESIIELDDDTDYFINQLPRKLQLEARSLFARHKTLATLEPIEQRKTSLQEDSKPDEVKELDIEYLINNFKI